MPDFIQTSDAARRLGVSPNTIRSWCEDGVLTHTKIEVKGRTRYFVHADEFEKLIQDGLVQSKEQSKRGRGRPSIFKAQGAGR